MFISVYLLFSSSRSLVNISCIFSILFQRSWIICTIIYSLGVYRVYDRVFILFSLWWRRRRGLWKLSDGRDWLRGKLGLVLMGGAVLSKSLIQFSVDGWGFSPSLLFDLSPNYGGGNEDSGNLLQKVPCTHCCTECPQLCSRLPLTQTSTRGCWTLMGKSGSVSCGVTAAFSWVLVHTQFCLFPPRVCFPSPVKVLVALRWG